MKLLIFSVAVLGLMPSSGIAGTYLARAGTSGACGFTAYSSAVGTGGEVNSAKAICHNVDPVITDSAPSVPEMILPRPATLTLIFAGVGLVVSGLQRRRGAFSRRSGFKTGSSF